VANIYVPVNNSPLSGGSGGGGGGGGGAVYSETFNASGDWSGPSGGYYTITVLEATHEQGTTPMVQVYELVGALYEQVDVDRVAINGSGDVTIRVTENIDTRFEGRITIIG
jgi:hypothetical protein